MILQIIPFSLEPDDEIYYKNKKLISLSWSNYSGSTCMNNGWTVKLPTSHTSYKVHHHINMFLNIHPLRVNHYNGLWVIVGFHHL